MSYEGINTVTVSTEQADEMIARYRRLGTPIEVLHNGDNSVTITVNSNKVFEPRRKNKFGSRIKHR